ncbi:MAG TPA: hypothetical protein VED40_16335 [Azospirillaceae bacterium]|nr:hypothetical protein [Azospirillaceae bacterium]
MARPFNNEVGAAAMLRGDFTPSFSVENAEKDAWLVLEVLAGTDVRADLAEAGLARFQRAAAAGRGGMDIAVSVLAWGGPAAPGIDGAVANDMGWAVSIDPLEDLRQPSNPPHPKEIGSPWTEPHCGRCARVAARARASSPIG